MVGETPYFGTKCESQSAFVDTTIGRAGVISKLNVYYQDGCIQGIKPTYGYKSSDARLIGAEKGKEFTLMLGTGEIVTLEYKAPG